MFRSLLLSVAAQAAVAQSPVHRHSPLDTVALWREVAAAVDQLNDAVGHGDTARMARLIADDYITITAGGQFDRKKDGLRLYGSRAIQIDSQAHTDRVIRVYDTAAVITNVWHLYGRQSGRPSIGVLAQTQVVAKRNGRWQIVGSQSTPVQAPAPPPPSDSAVATQLEALDAHRLQAVRRADVHALDTLLADDWLASGNTAATLTKRQYLDELAAGTRRYDDIRHEDVVVRVYGDAAVITGRSVGSARINAQEQNNPTRFTHVYVRRQGRWRMVSMQNSTVAPQAAK